MKRDDIIKELKNYFTIEELIDQNTFNRDGSSSWRYFTTELLETILFIRINLDKSMTINNWKWGGQFSQRGLRNNICSIVMKKTQSGQLYTSAHTLGAGVDFDVKGMSADAVRDWLLHNEASLPHKIRLEHKFTNTGQSINWVHLDTFAEDANPKVYLFNV